MGEWLNSECRRKKTEDGGQRAEDRRHSREGGTADNLIVFKV
jgi:hypothetical protein